MRYYLQYTKDGYDLLDILPKVIVFFLIDAKGEDIKKRAKVLLTMQFTNNKLNYKLLIRDISMFYKLGMFRD
ncbi:hypothetical protein [Wolbachia pipientis]|uniref:hypothetical protein n=1 Tax=Wolbachia pipientis TaxID=955 RepID=UPI0025A4348A|nr:hypothetical protein [Wolbachia pipientis]MDM8334906.1 hypothetical protein [Wolbachia pipientis]